MFLNWLVVSLRRFRRGTANALINIFGLSLGLFVFMVIFIYVDHEFRYDEFHTNGNRIHRLVTDNPGRVYQGVSRYAVMPAPLYDILKNDMSGVEDVSRLAKWDNVVVESTNKRFYEEYHFAADHGLVSILSFEAIAGNISGALERPRTAIISEKTATKLFGTSDAVGKVIKLTNYAELGDYTIEGVFRDFPSNSSLQFNIIVRFVDAVTATQASDLNSWDNSNYNYLVMLAPDADPQSLGRQLDDFYRKKWPGSENEENASAVHFTVQPLYDVYLGPNVNFDFAPRNDPQRLYMLATIACFVLVVAAINYVNLTTARAISRAKEVAVRKATGAQQSGLALQFIGDSIVLTIIAAAIAFLATWYTFPMFRDFIGKPLEIDLFSARYLLGVLGLTVTVGLAAGFYPAVILSSFQPAKVLKGNFANSSRGTILRNTLTVLQFSISGGLIICVGVIAKQLSYIESHDPGYQRDHIVSVKMADEGVRAQKQFFINELNRNPNIVTTSLATWMPHSVRTRQTRHWVNDSGEYDVSFFTINADENYIDLFGIKVIDGRNFKTTDKNAFLINETAARTYGWEHPVGMEFTGEGDDTVRIVGVIKDLHFESYRSPIQPLRIGQLKNWTPVLAIKIRPTDIERTLGFIERSYKSLATTDTPYTLTFLNEEFSMAYKSDLQLGKLVNLFSYVAIVIACLGLYGLSTHSISQRLKEICIRKVLGADTAQIAYLVLSRFFRVIMVGFVLACPIASYLMQEWLSGFAYHIDIGIWPFVTAFSFLFVVALVTVGTQALKATRTKATSVLKIE